MREAVDEFPLLANAKRAVRSRFFLILPDVTYDIMLHETYESMTAVNLIIIK